MSSNDGHTYALRRLEGLFSIFSCSEIHFSLHAGFRLTNAKAIDAAKQWKTFRNSSVVTFIEAFTSRAFGDSSSLMIATDYHPNSKTLSEVHFLPPGRYQNRGLVPEDTLWSYVIQIANALGAIHGANLAARVVDSTKVLLTDKNRIRLNACGILDVVQFDHIRPLRDLQREDLILFGRLILSLGTSQQVLPHNLQKVMEQFGHVYKNPLAERVFGLVTSKFDNVEQFLTGLESYVLKFFDHAQNRDDELTSHLSRELENSRIARLMMKLNFITERPEFGHDRQWAENGERQPIKLFRDYVFHQVDSQGTPVLDIAHVIACLNKLDAGTEEKIVLTSRDDQHIVLASYKELKKAVDKAFGELVAAAKRGGTL